MATPAGSGTRSYMRLALLTAALCLAPLGASATQESSVAPPKASVTTEATSTALPTVETTDQVVNTSGKGDRAPIDAPQAKRESDSGSAATDFHEQVCTTLVQAAQERDIPVAFFARLIWQESQFKPHAKSPVGAVGIAQFMPATARGMDLEDPFDPMQALPASAELLETLKERFGNIGLAAAAYNSTPRRISNWLRNKATLPAETQKYVKTITGRSAESWRNAKEHGVFPELPRAVPCTRVDKFVQAERAERRELEQVETRLIAERAEAERKRAETVQVATRADKSRKAKAAPATRLAALKSREAAPSRTASKAKATRVAQAKKSGKSAAAKRSGKIKVASNR